MLKQFLFQVKCLDFAIFRVNAVNGVAPAALGFWKELGNVVNFKVVELFFITAKSKAFNRNILVVRTLQPVDVTGQDATNKTDTVFTVLVFVSFDFLS